MTHSDPAGASRAVASRIAQGGDPALVFHGTGGGIHVLDADNPNDPKPWTGVLNPRLKTEGYTRDVRLVDDHIYAAAGPAGLVRFERDPITGVIDRDFVRDLSADAWALEIVERPGLTIALVGANDSTTLGRIYAFDVTASGPVEPALLGHVNTPGPVWSLAAIDGLAGGKVALVVALACDGIVRYDVDVSTGTPAFGDPIEPTGLSATPALFFRDVVVDRTAAGSARAFAATHRNGVYAFDLTASAFTTVGGGRFIEPIAGQLTYANGLAHFRLDDADVTSGRLVVGLGDRFEVERHYYGECETPDPCDCPAAATECSAVPYRFGVQVYENVHTGSPGAPEAELLQDPLAVQETLRPYALDVRRVSATGYFVDMACIHNGLRIVEGVESGGSWSLSERGAWDQTDGVPRTNDDLVVIDQRLWRAGEDTVLSHDLSSPSAIFQGPPQFLWDGGGHVAIGLRGFPDQGPAGPRRLYGSTQGPVAFIDASDPANLALQGGQETGGRCYCLNAADGLAGRRWVYAVNTATTLPSVTPTGSVRIFDVTGGAGPVAVPPWPPSNLEASYVHDGPGVAPSYLFDVAVRDVSATEQALYVSYGPKPHQVGPPLVLGQRGMGLLVLKVEGAAPPFSISFMDGAPATWMPADLNDPVGRVTYDGADTVYVGLGCHGIGKFDLDPSDPFTIDEVEYRPIPGCIQALPGPGNRLYVTIMNQGLGVMRDLNRFQSSAIDVHPTRFQPLALAYDPADTSKNALFVADSMAGVHRVEFGF